MPDLTLTIPADTLTKAILSALTTPRSSYDPSPLVALAREAVGLSSKPMCDALMAAMRDALADPALHGALRAAFVEGAKEEARAMGAKAVRRMKAPDVASLLGGL